jgi:hypothetical protein
MTSPRADLGRNGGPRASRLLRTSTHVGGGAREADASVSPEVAAVHGIDRVALRGQIHRVLLQFHPAPT